MAQIIFWNSLNTDTLGGALHRTLGPYQLANWLTIHGYTCKVIDFCHAMSTQDLVDITSKNIDSSTIAIGVSSSFWLEFGQKIISKKNANVEVSPTDYFEPDWVIAAREQLELKCQNIEWLLGGAGTVDWYSDSQQMQKKRFDWKLFHGFAEDSVIKYLDEKTEKLIARPLYDIQTSPGPFSNVGNIQPYEVLPLEFGRGCQFKCKFCRYPLLGRKKNTYIRDYSLVEDELLSNYDKYGVTRYSFIDDTMNENEDKIQALAEMAQRLPFKLEWVGFNRLDLIWSKPHTIELLEQSGLRGTFFGIESFNKKSSNMVGKAWNGTHGKEFLGQLNERWKDIVAFHLGFITGIGDETMEELQQTKQWCIDNNISAWQFSALSMSKNPNIEFKSTFDKEYYKYGYKFPHPLSDHYWESEYWTYNTARAAAVELNKGMDETQKVAGFRTAQLATVGYSFDDHKSTNIVDLPIDEIKQKTKIFLQNYVYNELK